MDIILTLLGLLGTTVIGFLNLFKDDHRFKRPGSQLYAGALCMLFVVGAVGAYRGQADRQKLLSKLSVLEAQGARTQAVVEQGRLPRTLTPKQVGSLVSALKAGPGGHVEVSVAQNDAETMEYAAQFGDVLRQSGWDVPQGISTSTLNEPTRGLRIAVHKVDAAPLHAATLQRALKGAGFDALGTDYAVVPPGSVMLIVGSR